MWDARGCDREGREKQRGEAGSRGWVVGDKEDEGGRKREDRDVDGEREKIDVVEGEVRTRL